MNDTITYVMQLNNDGEYFVSDEFCKMTIAAHLNIEVNKTNGKTYAFFEGGPSGLTINDADEFAEFAGFVEGAFDAWGHVDDPNNSLLQFLKDEELIAA